MHSNHLYALQVHAIFGYTLMLAGFTRILEICFFSSTPSFAAPDSDDSASDRTVADAATHSPEPQNSAARAFRHLPPFVSTFILP